MDIGLIISILFKILALGCVFAILFWMFNLVEGKVPEPFKQIVGWLKVFVMLVCGVIAIAFILQFAGIGTDFPKIR
jgi:hypothetical protein